MVKASFFGVEPKGLQYSLHGLNMLMLQTSTTVNDQRKTYTKLCQ